MMSEQQYRLEENNQTNELILWEDVKILNVFKSSYDNRKHLNVIVDRLNEQQTTLTALKEENNKLKDDKNQLHKVISKLRQEVAELKTRNAVLSSKLNQIPKNIKEVWLE